VVAFTTESGSLIVLNPADGTERLAVDLGGPGGLRPAIGDLDGDGDAEIAAVTTDGRVRAVDAAGETVFETDLDAPVNRRPLAVDFGGDANGSADDGADTARGLAVATAADGDRSISLLDATGEARWTTTPSVTPLSWRAPADTRSGPVLALGGANGNLETIDVSDGGTRYEVGLQDLPVAVGDADPGRVHVGGSGSIWAVDPARRRSRLETVRRRYAGKRPGRGRDRRRLSGPGRGESGWRRRARTEPEGRGDRPRQYRYRRRVRGPLFADVTGDGSAEVLIVAEDGRIVALSD